MSIILDFFVPGMPAPQGSKNAFIHPSTRRAVVVESSSKYLKPWREDIKTFAEDEMRGLTIIDGPVFLYCSFVLKRPKGLARLKPTPPAIKRPDTDKLLRAVGDALTGTVYTEDSRIIDIHGLKRTADFGEQTGVHIRVGEVVL